MKMFKSLAVSGLVAAACINPALAHDHMDKAEQGMAKSSKASAKTAGYIKNAAIGGMFEVESSKVAIEKSSNDEVKQFAQKMVDDHSNVNDELKATVAAQNIDTSLIPMELDAKHQAMLDKLQTSENFDADYIKAQTDAHKEAIMVFSKYAKSGDNKALRDFANAKLPALKEHKAMIPARTAR